MQTAQKPLTAADRSARSVFVGNISDRETGRPKGFGFCEFADEQMAQTAQRNLNGFELHGRSLRVDSATGGDRSADEVQQFQLALASSHVEENPYGPEPEVGKAPEAIARTVASMPPERMFELMKQMKETVNNNPLMARHLLMENPQLAYALLQAQVVMRVVDPKVAYSMLHREQPATTAPFHQQAAPPTQTTAPHGIIPTSHPPPMNFSTPPPQIPGMTMPPSSQAPPLVMSHPPPTVTAGFNMPPHILSHPPPSIASGLPPRMPVPPGGAGAPQQAESTSTALEEQQQAEMLVKVLKLTDDQIRLLPPEDRAKVIELRNQLRQQVPT
ncbi:hinge domain of cleavage stimulation factor subunit 2 domain-containing protein [Ditylenchus destructor]|nr:hinge domain of cleavage stimulation factor subunit 2 domain-containing protein [Ditylenchus destructor]